MKSLNEVNLIGNLGGDPEIRNTSNGGKVANLNVATSESWKDKATGEWKEKTEWHKVVVWNEYVIKACENLRKGDKVSLRGKLQTRKWQDQNGNDRWSVEVVLTKFDGWLMPHGKLPPKNGNGNGQANGSASNGGGFGSSAGGSAAMDDEIPF